MGIKIGKRKRALQQRKEGADDYIEVGQGEYCVITVNNHNGSTVVHRFRTIEEAQAQHARNLAADQPLVGVTEFH